MSPDSYWIIPQDVQERWAKLTDVLTGHSNCWLTVKLVVKGGGIEYVFEPTKRNVQPRNLQRSQTNQNWWSVIRQVQAIGCNVHGTAFLSFDVLVDTGGNPTVWTEIMVDKPRRV